MTRRTTVSVSTGMRMIVKEFGGRVLNQDEAQKDRKHQTHPEFRWTWPGDARPLRVMHSNYYRRIWPVWVSRACIDESAQAGHEGCQVIGLKRASFRLAQIGDLLSQSKLSHRNGSECDATAPQKFNLSAS